MYCYATTDIHCYLWLQEKIHWKMSVPIACHFMHKILQVQQGRTLYLSLPIHSVGRCIKCANVKFFSETNFLVYGPSAKTYTGRYISLKTCIFAYFIQCDVFHLSAQKLTHYSNKNNRHSTENN